MTDITILSVCILQLNLKKRLTYGAIAFIWIIQSAFVTTMGFLSTDIVKGSCVPWGVYSSYAAEKIITSFIFFVALLLPLIMMVFCYYKIVYKLKHTVSVRIFDSTFICSKHDNK